MRYQKIETDHPLQNAPTGDCRKTSFLVQPLTDVHNSLAAIQTTVSAAIRDALRSRKTKCGCTSPRARGTGTLLQKEVS